MAKINSKIHGLKEYKYYLSDIFHNIIFFINLNRFQDTEDDLNGSEKITDKY